MERAWPEARVFSHEVFLRIPHTYTFPHKCLDQGRLIWKASTLPFQTRWEKKNLQDSLGENLNYRRDWRLSKRATQEEEGA